jgi:hypothetical protein
MRGIWGAGLAVLLAFSAASPADAAGADTWLDLLLQRYNNSTPSGGFCIFSGYAACPSTPILGGCLPNGGHFYPWSDPMPCALCYGMIKNPYGGGRCTPA